jgi:hypothetical protein
MSVKVNTSDEWITGVFWHKQTQKKLIVTDKDGKKITYPMEKVQDVKLDIDQEYITADSPYVKKNMFFDWINKVLGPKGPN